MTQPTPPNSPFYPAGNAHPFPALALVQEHIAQIDDAERFPDHIATIPPPDPRLPPYSLDPSGAERQHIVPGQPHEIRTPAVLHYPKSVMRLIVNAGVNLPDLMLGFACRHLVVQNLATTLFLFIPEYDLYVSASATFLASIDLPVGSEKLSFIWHTALFNPVTPAAVPGQFATVWLYDEWKV